LISKKRGLFRRIEDSLHEDQIILLTGMRGSGNSTLLFQLIDQMIENGHDPFSIWYFSFDQAKVPLGDLMEKFKGQAEEEHRKDGVLVFLDEVQKIPDVLLQLESYHDLNPEVKFVLASSTETSFLREKEYGFKGSISKFNLKPLKFREYLIFREKEDYLDMPLVLGKEIEKEFDLYLKCQFVGCLGMTPEDRRQFIVTTVKKIIFEDIPQTFPIDNPGILWELFGKISKNSGLIINLQEMSKDLGISNKTLGKYLSYLEAFYLTKKIYNFSKNLKISEKRLKRYYLTSPTIYWAMNEHCEMDKMARNFVISLNDHMFFWRDVYGHEVDFIQIEGEKIIPIDVRYGGKMTDKDFKNLYLFSKKFKCSETTLIAKTLQEETIEGKSAKVDISPIYFEKKRKMKIVVEEK
jgi:uncharacterized protein